MHPFGWTRHLFSRACLIGLWDLSLGDSTKVHVRVPWTSQFHEETAPASCPTPLGKTTGCARPVSHLRSDTTSEKGTPSLRWATGAPTLQTEGLPPPLQGVFSEHSGSNIVCASSTSHYFNGALNRYLCNKCSFSQ